MLRRVTLFNDEAGLVLRIMGLELEEIEHIPPSEGDRLLYARVKELGLSESADLLLKGEELVIPNHLGFSSRRRQSRNTRPRTQSRIEQLVGRSAVGSSFG